MYVLCNLIIYVFISFSLDMVKPSNDTETEALARRRNHEDQLKDTLVHCKSITVFLKLYALQGDVSDDNLDTFEYNLDSLPAFKLSLRSSSDSRKVCEKACSDAAMDTCDECDCSHDLKKKLHKACKRACKDEF